MILYVMLCYDMLCYVMLSVLQLFKFALQNITTFKGTLCTNFDLDLKPEDFSPLAHLCVPS